MQSGNIFSLDLEKLGLSFDSEKGLLTVSGKSLELLRNLDSLFCQWGNLVNAIEYTFPMVLSVGSLALADYFNSFPHLATLTTRIEPKDIEIKNFVNSTKNQPLEYIEKEYQAPSRYVLPSAACYAIYDHFKKENLEKDLYITTKGNCFRHENSYTIGQRQWAFQMREIVCIGELDSVKNFLDTYRSFLEKKLLEASMPFSIVPASDPFFDKRDPKLLMQKMEPVKYEIVYREKLAIASINFHRNFFGERFKIKSHSGAPAFSGCVAFGLERWLYSCLNEYGKDLDKWPDVLQK